MINVEEKCLNNEYENEHIYIEWSCGHQSFGWPENKPIYICVNDRECDISFKSKQVHKKINLKNYSNLIAVFYKYESILSKDSNSSFKKFPYGGVSSFKYRFNGKENLSDYSSLFESDNELLIERAYEDYNRIIENIVNQI